MLPVLRHALRSFAVLVSGAAVCMGQQASLEFLSDVNIVTGTPFLEAGTRAPHADAVLAPGELSGAERLRRKVDGGFGGLSAIAYNAQTGKLYALSDSAKPTIYVFRASFEGTALRLEPIERMLLRDKDGEPISLWVLDPEGLALTASGEFFVSSEGYGQRTPPVPQGVFHFDKDGRMVGSLRLPPGFAPAETEGPGTNLGFEALTLSPSGEVLFAGTEGPLRQDGARCSVDAGCRTRIVEFRRRGQQFEPVRDFVYQIGAMSVPEGFNARSGGIGLAEMLALDDQRLLVLERGFAVAHNGGIHQTIQILQTTTEGGSLGEKRLVIDVADVVDRFTKPYQSLDNFEGLCFGPLLDDGGRTVLLVSDDNYNERQRTSFLAFRLTEH